MIFVDGGEFFDDDLPLAGVYLLDSVFVGERVERGAGVLVGCLLPLDLFLLVVVGDLPLVNLDGDGFLVANLLPYDFLDDEFCLVDM